MDAQIRGGFADAPLIDDDQRRLPSGERTLGNSSRVTQSVKRYSTPALVRHTMNARRRVRAGVGQRPREETAECTGRAGTLGGYGDWRDIGSNRPRECWNEAGSGWARTRFRHCPGLCSSDAGSGANVCLARWTRASAVGVRCRTADGRIEHTGSFALSVASDCRPCANRVTAQQDFDDDHRRTAVPAHEGRRTITGNVVLVAFYSPRHVYPTVATFIAIMVLCLWLTICGSREPTPAGSRGQFELFAFIRSFYLDPRLHRNFYWVLVTRLFGKMGIWSIFAFMLY
jgi:hypothetical protein